MTDRATLVAYDSEWPIRFAAEKRIIEAALGPGALVEPIGSTAVPGLEAKPVLDIMVGGGLRYEGGKSGGSVRSELRLEGMD